MIINTLPFTAALHYGPLKPSSIPVLPPLNLGFSPYGSTARHRYPDSQDYRPKRNDDLAKRNGELYYNYIITSGSWWLFTGDRLCAALTLNPGVGAYASPTIVPDTGVGGLERMVGELRKRGWEADGDYLSASL